MFLKLHNAHFAKRNFHGNLKMKATIIPPFSH